MSEISQDIQLSKLNTFKVQFQANYFLELDSLESILEALPKIRQYKKKLILGGGSNILFVGDYDGLILFPRIFGISLLQETEDYYQISVGASEIWHDWVIHSNHQGWYGLENLALIPGTVGAAPIQNIGAYGVEVKQFIHRVECVDLELGEVVYFSNEACDFGYRDSYFKRSGQGKYLVTRVEFNLSKQAKVNLQYKALNDQFNGQDKSNITPKEVLDQVCQIRQEKLPDPKELPNAGSFFKNPIVSQDKFDELKSKYPNIVGYPNKQGVKLAAGWLIDNAGYKGMKQGKIGIHEHQALVLVNYGESDGNKIFQLAKFIQSEIQTKYDVLLETEVSIEGSN